MDYSKFGTTKQEVAAALGFRKWFNNHKDKVYGIYRPRLTLIKRGGTISVKIEFSAPKMIFGNNVDEAEEKDLDRIIKELKRRVEEMGVLTTESFIQTGAVSAFHPSKNIMLTGGYTSSFAIKELAKVYLNRKLDFSETKFRNDGSSIQYYAKAHSLVFYDKVYDLKQPRSRAIDKEQMPEQRSLFDEINNRPAHLEILRMETRLSQKPKMNAVLEKLGYKPNPTFKDIFKKDLCQKILLDYWQNMVAEKYIFLFDMTGNPLRVLQRTIKNNRRIKPKQAIYMAGLELLCKDGGIRELRQTIELISEKRAWHNLSKDIAHINAYGKDLHPYGFIRDIERDLKEFKPFQLKSYPLDM